MGKRYCTAQEAQTLGITGACTIGSNAPCADGSRDESAQPLYIYSIISTRSPETLLVHSSRAVGPTHAI